MRIARVGTMLAIAGCGVNTGGAGDWTAIDQLVPPLVPEVELAIPPNPFRSAHPVATDPVRVVTYNIFEEEPATDPLALAAAIEESPELAAAGVFILQEAEQYPGEAESRARPIADRLGLGYVYVPEFTKGAGHTDGIAILSAYPIANVMRMDLPLAGPHRHAAVAADIIIGARTLHVIGVHLETRTNAAQRIAQLRPAVLDAPEATLVAGDLNTFPVEWAGGALPILNATEAAEQIGALDSYMHALGFAAPTQGSGPTAFGYGQEGRSDAIYTRGLTATYGNTPRIGPSDHWPVWIDVEP